MKFKSLAIAGVLALAATSSFANLTTNLGTLTPPQSVGFNNTVSGSFMDTYNFSLSDASNVGVSITNFSFFNVGNIMSFAAMLDGNALTLTSLGVAQQLAGSATLTGGNHVLTVSGIGGRPNASYGGNVVAAPVPEPESFAMLLAGLGLMGAIARRRNKTTV